MTKDQYNKLNKNIQYRAISRLKGSVSVGVLAHYPGEGWLYCSDEVKHHGRLSKELYKYNSTFKYIWGNLGHWYGKIDQVDDKFLNNFN